MSSSMWLARRVSLLTVFIILVCNTEANPKRPDLSNVSDDDFLNLLGANGAKVENKGQLTTCPCPELGGECRCADFHACQDPRPADVSQNYGCFSPLFDERAGTSVISIGERNTSPCKGLKICCKCTKGPKGDPITPRPTTPEPITPPPSQCGKRNPDGVGVTVMGFTDSQTQVGEFPWMVAVLKKDTTYVAGGSLVHPRVIITAGHKVHDKNANDLVVRVGDWDLKQAREHPAPQAIDVDRIVYHTDFVRPTHENNVALLILKKDVVFNKLVMPICLPQSNQDFDGSKNCFVTGWGKNSFDGDFQTIMKRVSMPMVGHRQCETALRRTRLGSDYTLHDSFVCAGDKGEDACTGDGGSPLVCPDPSNPAKYVQVGVVSWGIGCNVVGNPGVYGSIPKTVDWITKTINAETGGIDERVQYDVRIGK